MTDPVGDAIKKLMGKCPVAGRIHEVGDLEDLLATKPSGYKYLIGISVCVHCDMMVANSQIGPPQEFIKECMRGGAR